jgi:hypothetical protein
MISLYCMHFISFLYVRVMPSLEIIFLGLHVDIFILSIYDLVLKRARPIMIQNSEST